MKQILLKKLLIRFWSKHCLFNQNTVFFYQNVLLRNHRNTTSFFNKISSLHQNIVFFYQYNVSLSENLFFFFKYRLFNRISPFFIEISFNQKIAYFNNLVYKNVVFFIRTSSFFIKILPIFWLKHFIKISSILSKYLFFYRLFLS